MTENTNDLYKRLSAVEKCTAALAASQQAQERESRHTRNELQNIAKTMRDGFTRIQTAQAERNRTPWGVVISGLSVLVVMSIAAGTWAGSEFARVETQLGSHAHRLGDLRERVASLESWASSMAHGEAHQDQPQNHAYQAQRDHDD